MRKAQATKVQQSIRLALCVFISIPCLLPMIYILNMLPIAIYCPPCLSSFLVWPIELTINCFSRPSLLYDLMDYLVWKYLVSHCITYRSSMDFGKTKHFFLVTVTQFYKRCTTVNPFENA